MRRLFLLILALATLLPSLALAYDVLVLQNRRDPGFDEVLKGYNNGQTASQRIIILSDYADVDVVRIVREDRPAMILAIGDSALNAARKVQSIPVLALMSLGIETGGTLTRNITGISLFIPPEHYCSLFKKLNCRRVGVVFSSARSAAYLQKARAATSQAGIELVTREVTSGQESVGQLQSLKGKVDAIWMLPDTVAVTRENSEAYLLFGLQNQVPVISFAPVYLGSGASVVLDIDRVALGKQAAILAEKILNGENTAAKQTVTPQVIRIKTNPAILNKLKLSLGQP